MITTKTVYDPDRAAWVLDADSLCVSNRKGIERLSNELTESIKAKS